MEIMDKEIRVGDTVKVVFNPIAPLIEEWSADIFEVHKGDTGVVVKTDDVGCRIKMDDNDNESLRENGGL